MEQRTFLGYPVVSSDNILALTGALDVDPGPFWRVLSEHAGVRAFWGVTIYRDHAEDLCETLRLRFPGARVWFEQSAPGFKPDAL